MTKELLIEKLNQVLTHDSSIKLHVDRIYQLRLELDPLLGDEEKIMLSGQIKSRVQLEASEAFRKAGGFGSVFIATGGGKSKIGVDEADKVIINNPLDDILICVPTEKLRDEGWKEEFTKWGFINSWDFVERCCYASLNKFEGRNFGLVILDEVHNITENNSKFFEQNKARSVLALTATKPRDQLKNTILRGLGIHPVYELTLDESVKLGLVAPYDITIVTTTLDTVDKYVKAGNAKNRFYQTEYNKYSYLTQLCLSAPGKMNFLARMRFVYNLKSKTEAAKWILKYIIPEELRTMIFCGSKRQAIEVHDRRYFSRPTINKKDRFKAEKVEEHEFMLANYEGDAALNDFKASIINRIACCEALNEGHNFDGLDVAFIIQLNSDDKDLIQRIGRILRVRPGHIGKIIILCCENTVDKDWVKKATAGLDQTKIRIIELSHLKVGIESIFPENLKSIAL